MAIPMGPTTATLMVSFAAFGGCGFWWQSASTHYDSEVSVVVEAQGETILEGVRHSNAEDNNDKVANLGVDFNEGAEDIGFEQANDVTDTLSTLAEKPGSDVDVSKIEASKGTASEADVKEEALVIETAGSEQDNSATITLAETLEAKNEVGADKESISTYYYAFEAPFWMPALGIALACDAVALMFAAMCCRRMLRRSADKDEEDLSNVPFEATDAPPTFQETLSNVPFEETHTPPTFQEAKKPSLDEPIGDSEDEEEEDKSAATISLEKFEGLAGKNEVSAGFDVTQIPSPIGRRSSANNDPFRFQ